LKPRYLEGEPFIYKGYLWFVKGYQHPIHGVVGFPRYNLINFDKPYDPSHAFDKLFYWDCLKQEIPLINPDEALFIQPRENGYLMHLVRFVADSLGFDDYVLSGSILIGGGRDIDIVVYGFDDEYIAMLEKLFDNEVFHRLNYYYLYNECLSKHIHDTDPYTYLYIKKNTFLHFIYRSIHFNIKFNKYVNGVFGCVDRVYRREFFNDFIEIVEPIDKYVIPSKYIVETSLGRVYLESYREMYAELPKGRYIINGFLEYRDSGVYVVPDHGSLRIVL